MSQPLRPALLAALGLCLLASGCSMFHRGGRTSCREPDVARDAVNLPPLKVPAGVDAPDTRNAIQVPGLDTAPQPRRPGQPCLSSPPSYKGAG